jgi:DNA-binding transcriptional MocR family regulator
MVDENYDDDEHLEEIRKKIFERYDAALRRLAEEESKEKNSEQQNKV